MKTLKILLDDNIDHVSITLYTRDGIGCLAVDERFEVDTEDKSQAYDMTTKKESEGKINE